MWALPEAELQGHEDAKSSVSCWHAAGTGHCGRERVDLTRGSILTPVCLTVLHKTSSPIPTRTTRAVAVETAAETTATMAQQSCLGQEREKLMHKHTSAWQAQHC